MEFSLLQYTGKVDDKVHNRTQITKVVDMICVAEFFYLCPRLSPQGSFGENREVGIMKFGLNIVCHQPHKCTGLPNGI